MIVKNVSGAVVVDVRSAHVHTQTDQPQRIVGSQEETRASFVTLSAQAQLHIEESRERNQRYHAQDVDGEPIPPKPTTVDSPVPSQQGAETEQAEETSKLGSLTEEERDQVKELQIRDREVRTHEQAHIAAAGPYARGGPRYEYQTGPDNRRYAVGGEVSIDTSPVRNDPEATIKKMDKVRQAALAPREPSPQDRAIAAKAAAIGQRAQAELAQSRVKSKGPNVAPDPTNIVRIQDALGAYRRVA